MISWAIDNFFLSRKTVPKQYIKLRLIEQVKYITNQLIILTP